MSEAPAVFYANARAALRASLAGEGMGLMHADRECPAIVLVPDGQIAVLEAAAAEMCRADGVSDFCPMCCGEQ